MRSKRFLIAYIGVLLLFVHLQSSNVYQWPLGDLKIAFPAQINEINLYHLSGNSAWLQASDSLNWMMITMNSANSKGDLRRYWDAYGISQNNIAFSGQKHVTPNRAFYGEIRYNMDFLSRVNKAVELDPYAQDPFVACDSVEGDFSLMGPQIKAVFSQRLGRQFWWGAGLDYQIYQGLKQVYSRPEIIRRKIRLDLSIAYQVSPNLVAGFSVRPIDVQELIKIVKQPDGTSPVIYRYRGEFLFTSVTGSESREARTRGWELQPQVMFNSKRLKAVIHAGYFYQWHEVYDNPLVRHYEGYYQGQNYYFSMMARYFLSGKLNSSVTFRYKLDYLKDWAEEPVKKLAIYRSWQRTQQFSLGFAKRLGNIHPLILGFEGEYERFLPDKRDYLAHVFRKAAIYDWSFKLGIDYSLLPGQRLFTSAWYKNFTEPPIWNYFQNYQATGGSIGYYLNAKKMIWIFISKFAKYQGTDNQRSKYYLNFQVQLRKFL